MEQHLEKNGIVKFVNNSDPDGSVYWKVLNGKLYVHNLEKESLGNLLFTNLELGLWEYLLLTITIYNLLRTWLTFEIIPLKEEHSRTSYTPSKAKIFRLYKIHRINLYLSFLVYVPLLYYLYKVLSATLYFPVSWIQ